MLVDGDVRAHVGRDVRSGIAQTVRICERRYSVVDTRLTRGTEAAGGDV